jgi:uncharacterized membrane protein YkvA (DUF1232 family)
MNRLYRREIQSKPDKSNPFAGINFSAAKGPALIEKMAKSNLPKPKKKQSTSTSIRKVTQTTGGRTAAVRRGRPPHEKAAIRSDAFAKAVLDATSCASDPDSLRTLFKEASAKAAAIPKSALNELGPYLQAMLRLVRAYARGDYRQIAQDSFLTIVAAISYLVDPFDLIPDEVPFLGFVDDATVIGFAVSRTREALDDFMIWETTGA